MKKISLIAVIFLSLFFVYSCSSVRYIKGAHGSEMRQKSAKGQAVTSPQVKSATLKYPSISTLGAGAESFQQLKKKFVKVARDIHFKFNSYEIVPIHQYGIDENPKDILDKIANFMLRHPKIKIKIEGNCDERGTIEYNLALGEKRALAAKGYLVSKGVSPDRITIISYGKSRPLDPHHNPWAWAKNRRDHFVILK